MSGILNSHLDFDGEDLGLGISIGTRVDLGLFSLDIFNSRSFLGLLSMMSFRGVLGLFRLEF